MPCSAEILRPHVSQHGMELMLEAGTVTNDPAEVTCEDCLKKLEKEGTVKFDADDDEYYPVSDGTRLGDELAELERTDPKVRDAAIGLETFLDRARRDLNYCKPIDEWKFDG